MKYDCNEMWLTLLTATSAAGISERQLFCGTSLAIVFVFFYLHGWFYVLADWYGFLDRYAIRSGSHKVATIEKQWDAIKEASLDVFVVKPLVLYFVYPFVAGKYILFGAEIRSLPVCLLQWVCMKLIFSTSLYWLHRAMHHKSVYQYVHKRHHTYHDTVGFASQYAHPVEGLLSAWHVISAIYLVRPHFVVYCAFLASTLVEIIDSHCGYDVPWAWLYPWSDRYFWGSGARAHDYHHSHNVGIYGGGLTRLWDKLLGTDVEFRRFEEKRLAAEKKAC
jgi:sterol desaturase/sphingolipid hydroxylase (fatty acid hydroxylase superfamily)